LNYGLEVFKDCSYSPEYTTDEDGCKYMKIAGNPHFVLIASANTETVNINNNCKSIGYQAFHWKNNITTISIPESVTSISDDGFEGCQNLVSITIPSTVKCIGKYAFSSCDNLVSITIPEGITSINRGVFYSCDNLVSVTIPSSVTNIDHEAFSYCKNLTSVKIPDGAKVYSRAFDCCEKLTTVTLPGNCEVEYRFEFSEANLVICDAANQEACSWRGILWFPENCNFVWNCKNKRVTADAAEVEGVKYGAVTADHNDFVYAYGDTAILTATPNTDCKFVGWSDGNHDNPRKVVVLDNEVDATVNTYTAAFYPNTAETYEILVTTNNTATNLRGTVSGDGVYLKDAQVTLTATPTNANLYHFVGWSNGTVTVSTNATYSFTATEDVSLTAIFEGQTVNIGDNTVKAVGRNTDNCTFHPTLTGRYTITSTFDDVTETHGYLLDDEGNILKTNYLGGEINNFKIVYNLEAGKTYHIGAGFHDENANGEVLLNISTPDMVIRTAAIGNGVVDGAGYFPYNQPATVTANPNPGYHFVKWQDGNTENPRNFTVTESATFTATFEINTYTIAIDEAENGTTSGAGTYTHGQSVTLTASAAEGYHFVGWGDGNSETTRTFSASEDMNLTPTFAINQYTVSVEFEHGSVTGTGTYNHGQTAHLVASASEGFEFAGWSDDCETAERDTVVTSNVALRAIFISEGQHMYNIKVATPENGTIAGAGKYIVGATATLHAYAAEGYHFVGWGDGNTDTLRVIENVSADMQLTPSFAINQYTVAVSKADNGTVTGAATYNHGDAVKVVATANTGYHFAGWSTGETSDTLKFTATRDTAFTPSFEINTYKVTAVAEKGSVAGLRTYTHGSDATITAYPEDGYHFVKWADGVESATRTLVVLKDTAFTALFEINKYTASVAESAHGSVSGAGEYTHGQTATFAATPDAGYQFLFWSDGSKVNPRIVKMTKDVEMRAVFSLEGHSAFNVTLGSSAHGTVTGGGLYIEGETATLTAKPESAAYHFVGWSDNNTDNPRNVVVDKEISLVATFAINTYTVKAATHENETERGSVTGGGTYNYGDMATLRATPAEGFRFTGWSDGDVYNIKYLSITKDTAFTAHFAPAVGTDTLYVDKIIEKIVEKVITDTIKIDRIIKDTVKIEGSGEDTVYIHENVYLKDTIYVKDTVYITADSTIIGKADTVYITKTDTVYVTVTDTVYIEKETGKPTAINAVAATAVNIYAHHNTIVVENAEDEIRVYDAMGRLIVETPHCDVSTEIRVNGTGIYIVKTGNTAKRVMIND
jgi:hypothetical protein